jgi:hypothetical protein
MPLRVIDFEDTPNPNAIKCNLDACVHDGSASFRSRDDAQAHPLARAIFELKGVNNLLLCNDWLTVGREAGSPWAPIKRGVRDALANHT